MAKPNPGRMKKAVTVGTAMPDLMGHPMQQRTINLAAAPVIEDAGYTAHLLLLRIGR